MDTRALRKWLPYFGFVICLLVGMFGMQFHARGAGWLLEIGALAVAVLSFAAVFLMDLRSTEKLSRVPRKTFWTFMGALFAVSLFVWQIILALPEGWTDQHQHPIIATIIAISVFILGWAGIIAYLGQAVAIIACGFIPGTRGPNRFGPDPLGRTPRPQPKPVLPQGEQAAITVARSLDQYEEQPKPNSPPPPPPPVPVAASQPAAVSSENGEVTGMTNTRSGLPQKGRWKWVVIGIVGGVTLAVVVANVIRFRTVRWDTKSVSTVSMKRTASSGTLHLCSIMRFKTIRTTTSQSQRA